MRVLFAGTPEVAVPTLQALLDSEHEVVGVLSRADARQGRGRKLVPSPVAALAREHNLNVFTPASLRNEEASQWVHACQADVAVVVAYGRIVPPNLLTVPTHGWLNLHFSLLPAWRGAAPVQRAIINGDQVTGAAVFALEEGLDTGPIYAQLERPIDPRDTSGSLLSALANDGAPLVLQVLQALASGQAVATPQASEGISEAPMLAVSDAKVDWNTSAVVIDRLIRGVTPAPGAWTTLAGVRLRLGPVELVDAPQLEPGEVLASKRQVLVGTADGVVALGQVAPAGKKWMDAAAWARGARLAEHTVLGQEVEAN